MTYRPSLPRPEGKARARGAGPSLGRLPRVPVPPWTGLPRRYWVTKSVKYTPITSPW